MLKIKELRMVNRIRPLNPLDPEKTPLLGYRIAPQFFYNIGSDEELNSRWAGISLTREIFLKLGFTSYPGVPGAFMKKINPCYTMRFFQFATGWKLEFFHYMADIQFVHQLQNLYLLLAGEELEIPKI